MNKVLKSLAIQVSLASVAFMAVAAPPSADCKKAQESVNKNGIGTMTLSDLTAHPTLAGVTTVVTIRIKNALGKEARDRCNIVIPQVDFRHPLAISMVELRRTLAQDTRRAEDVAQRFSKLLDDKAGTVPNPETLALLKTIHKNLSASKDNEALEGVVRDMWDAMQRLEQDNISPAERNLADMEKALREALERNAGEEELRKLTEESISVTKEALKEQAAKSGKDEPAKKDFDEMQKKLDEMKKLLEKMEQMNPELAKEMQKMMQQLQEMMKQQPQQNQDQQQKQEQMRQKMDRQMQQMMEQMQQQQQIQQMQQDLNKLIDDQEKLRNETAAEREKRKEDMEAILKKLEEYSIFLKQKINDQRSKEYDKKYQTLPESYTPDVSFLTPGASITVAMNGGVFMSAQNTVPKDETDNYDKRIKRLSELADEVDETTKPLKNIRESGRQLRESEAEDFLARFQRIQNQLKETQDEHSKENPPPSGKKSPEQKKSEQEQQGMLERIKKLMEDMKKKTQKQEQPEQQPPSKSQQQKDMQKKLDELIEKMREKNMDPGKLKDAEKSMGDAKSELDKNAPGDAVPKQDEALDQLREGQEQMKQQMIKKPGKGPGPGDGEGKEATHKKPTDVLGRPMPRDAQDIGPLDSENLSRARREIIRERLENRNLPQEERDYLERLLKGGKPKFAPIGP